MAKGDSISIGTGGASVSEAGTPSGSGTLTVTVNLESASWSLAGPESFGTETGTGSATFEDAPAGAYVLSFDWASGYAIPPLAWGNLDDGGTLALEGFYEEQYRNRFLSGRRIVEKTMRDRCRIATPTPTIANGEEVLAFNWSTAPESKCIYNPSASREVPDGTQATLRDAEILLPIGTSISSTSRIRIEKVFGRDLPSGEYLAVLGIPSTTPSALVVSARRIEGGSIL